MNWLQLEINVGVLNKGQQYQFEFIKAPTCKNIINTKPSCDCTEVNYSGNSLFVKYKAPSEVSPEMIKLGIFAQHITKEIEIIYEDNSVETLRFYATILD